jgi:IS5 family transposase
MKPDFNGNEQVPDATTLCKFRKLLDENGVTKILFESVKSFLEKHGKIMHGGSIQDATIIAAPDMSALKIRGNPARASVGTSTSTGKNPESAARSNTLSL